MPFREDFGATFDPHQPITAMMVKLGVETPFKHCVKVQLSVLTWLTPIVLTIPKFGSRRGRFEDCSTFASITELSAAQYHHHQSIANLFHRFNYSNRKQTFTQLAPSLEQMPETRWSWPFPSVTELKINSCSLIYLSYLCVHLLCSLINMATMLPRSVFIFFLKIQNHVLLAL